MAKLVQRLAVLLVVTTASWVGTAVPAGATAPPLTPQQQQVVCIAQKAAELLKAIDKRTWSDPKARDAAIKAVAAQAKAACPLGGATQPGGHSVTEVTPTATRVVELGSGQYRFEWDRSIPAGAVKGDVLFTFTERCPRGDQEQDVSFVPQNYANVPFDIVRNGDQASWRWYRTEAPQPPLGVTYTLTCDDRTGGPPNP